jgi:hypothetical protein
VRKKMEIDRQVLRRKEFTAGKAIPCTGGGDPIGEA